MRTLKVLVACEESQAVCKAFRELGHEAYSCDILECSGGHPEWHIQGDCLRIINGHNARKALFPLFRTCDGKYHTLPNKWDLIVAHPPCTYLTNAGARHLWKGRKLNQERYEKGLPLLKPTDVVEPTATWCPSGSYSHKHGEKHRGMFTTDRAKNRSKTFPGIAKAMAEQWSKFILESDE